MASKQCDKCGEKVDEAKAFCPGCGNAFVEEKKRTSVSDFEMSEHTVKLGDTMYNQMLSDMGLKISKTPRPGEMRVQAIAPPVPAAAVSHPERNAEPAAPKYRRTIIIAVALIVATLAILVAVAVMVAAVLYFR